MTLPRSWEASYWGQRFTNSRPWRITLEAHQVEIVVGARTFRAPTPALQALAIKPGLFWAAINFAPKGEQAIRLDGLPNIQACAGSADPLRHPAATGRSRVASGAAAELASGG